MPDTTKIRAYSGRFVASTDISPFIRNLPFQKDTTHFSTENASGSTSQAASIMEVLEAGARVLLMDEDTCASNFMIRDIKMQQLVYKKWEPITPFIDKVRHLYQEYGISTILVLGGTGDYFDVADHVLQMVKFKPRDVTAKAQKIAHTFPAKRNKEDRSYPFSFTQRVPILQSVNPYLRNKKRRIKVADIHQIDFGQNKIDLTDLEQLYEESQTRAIASAMQYARRYMDKGLTLKAIIDQVDKDIKKQGLDILSHRISGNLSAFRNLELASALSRMRSFRVRANKNSN